MKDQDLDLVVLNYLKAKGYKQAEKMFKQEAKVQTLSSLVHEVSVDMDTTVLNYITFYNSKEKAKDYATSYASLLEWVHSSLDLYRAELMQVMYPVFIHCYLDLIQRNESDLARAFMDRFKGDHMEAHASEIQQISCIITPQHLHSNQTTKMFRNAKYNISMCSYSFELLVSFLQQAQFMLLLSIINQYLNIKVFTGEPNPLLDHEYHSYTGIGEQQVKATDGRVVHWGVLEDSIPAKAVAYKIKSEALPATKPEEYSKSTIALPTVDRKREAEELEDIKKRIYLTASSLPSVCFYTFLNTYDNVNCMQVSHDGSMVVCGCSDSSLKLWNLKKPGNEQWKYDKLISHSGEVYAVSFSPASDFILSCSQDTTIRLWSVELKTALVCYRGHSYPVWDVCFSPRGYYFVSGSADRTARLWSTDHVHPLRIFAGHLSDVDSVQFHPNCNYVATGSSDKTVRLWEVSTGSCVRLFTGHTGAVDALAFSPNGRYIASGGQDKNVFLWDIATSKKLKRFGGHRNRITTLDFSCEGTVLVSGSTDSTIRIWNTAADVLLAEQRGAKPPPNTQELLKMLATKKVPVYLVKFTPRNILMAAGALRS